MFVWLNYQGTHIIQFTREMMLKAYCSLRHERYLVLGCKFHVLALDRNDKWFVEATLKQITVNSNSVWVVGPVSEKLKVFRLQPYSRNRTLVFPIFLKLWNQTRSDLNVVVIFYFISYHNIYITPSNIFISNRNVRFLVISSSSEAYWSVCNLLLNWYVVANQ